MRSMMTGMLICMIGIFFATWFFSSVVLKVIKNSKSLSSSVNSESIIDKINSNDDSMSYTKNGASVSSYARAPRQTRYSRTSPFGSKLNLRSNPHPFGPKLDLGRNPHPFGPKLDLRNPMRRNTKQYSETKQKAESSQQQSGTSTSKIISGYQNYIDVLNEQMKD